MLTDGNYYTLRINRSTENGQYLIDEEGTEVLLPNRYVTEDKNEGDEVDVFVYHDSEDRLVATTEKPLVAAGEAALLKVVDKTIHGVFLDWGLQKDLFLPVRNQFGRMDVDQSYVVFVYVDNVTGRVTASARLNSFIRNDELTVAPGDDVDIMIAVKNDLGYRVIINNRHWGMLYSNQIFQPVAIGDKMRAHVRRITEDKRIDVSLQLQGYNEVKKSADRLMELIRSAGGTIALDDSSAPEEIYARTNMSKKVFKRTAGYLMKKGALVMKDGKLSLSKLPAEAPQTK